MEERDQKSGMENQEWRCRHIKPIDRWYLDLVVKLFTVLIIQILGLLIAPLSKIKSCGVVPSFYIKMMKWETFQTCSFKYSIKEGMFSVLGKLNLFKSGREREVILPSLPWWSVWWANYCCLEIWFDLLFGVPRNLFERQE